LRSIILNRWTRGSKCESIRPRRGCPCTFETSLNARTVNGRSNRLKQIEEHPDADAAVEHDAVSGDGEWSHEVDLTYVPSTEEEGQYRVFVTNQHVEPGEMHRITKLYDRRWDIEIEYKTIKSFLPRTSSMDYQVRFGLFVFATMLYNLWRLTDLLVKRSLGKRVREATVVTARTLVRGVSDFLRGIG
jgi:IS4 transposase